MFVGPSMDEVWTRSQQNWEVLPLFLIVIAGIVGNLLVCIAICREKKLQNTTNYFLMSLSVADLFVCCIVMPLAIVNEFMGLWPLGLIMCDMWQVTDVMMCTSSIMHMCIISMDRYMAIRNPIKSRNKSRTSVGIKIATVWLISLATASPLIILCIIHPGHILNEDIQCGIFNHHFQMYGSLTAFFIPLTIMAVAYSLTIQLLRKQAITSSKNGGIRRTFSTKRKKFFSKESVPVLKKISDRYVESPLNGYKLGSKKMRNSTESDRKTAHPSETEPLAIPQQMMRKASNISITTTLTALNSPRPSIGCTQTTLNSQRPSIKSIGCAQPAVNSHRTSIGCTQPTVNSPRLSIGCTQPAVNSQRASISCAQPSLNLPRTSIGCAVNSQRASIGCVQPTLNSHRASMGSTQVNNNTNIPDHNHSQSNHQDSSTLSHMPNKESQLQYLTTDFCQIESPTNSDNWETWEVYNNEPCPPPPPPPSRRYSHSVSFNKSQDKKATKTTTEHRASCTSTDIASKSCTTTNNIHSKSKSEADISVHITHNLKPETQKLSLICLGNNHHLDRPYGPPINTSDPDKSVIQLHVPQTSVNNNATESVLYKAIRKLSWGRLPKGAETLQSSNENNDSPSKADNDNTKNEAPPTNLKFRELMQKHRAAFKVAGILMAKREEKNQVKTERKAIKVLGTMFIIFVICWAPFFSTNFTMGVCKSCDIHIYLFKFFLWLGYVGSTLNPIIYTVFNKTFRKAFINLLTCGKYKGRRNQFSSSLQDKTGSCKAEDMRTFTTSSTHYKNIPSDLKTIYDKLHETHL